MANLLIGSHTLAIASSRSSPSLYAVKPDRVINAAENLVRSVKKNLVNSVKNLLGREPQVLIAPRIFSSDDAPKDISSLYLPSNLEARAQNLSKSGNSFDDCPAATLL